MITKYSKQGKLKIQQGLFISNPRNLKSQPLRGRSATIQHSTELDRYIEKKRGREGEREKERERETERQRERERERERESKRWIGRYID